LLDLVKGEASLGIGQRIRHLTLLYFPCRKVKSKLS
jgi:hypothetical protein